MAEGIVKKESVYISVHSILCPACFTEIECIIGTGTFITAHCSNPKCEKEWVMTIRVEEIKRQ